MVGGDSDSLHAQVTADYIPVKSRVWSLLVYYDMQVEAFLAVVPTEVGRTDLPGKILVVANGKVELHLYSATGSSKGSDTLF